jgi:hypothetical protein
MRVVDDHWWYIFAFRSPNRVMLIRRDIRARSGTPSSLPPPAERNEMRPPGAVLITATGGPDVLVEQQAWPVPLEIGPEEVLIEVAAAGVNRHDCNQRAAEPSREANPVPGLEASGRIVARGARVPESRQGEAVIALTDGGAYAQYVTRISTRPILVLATAAAVGSAVLLPIGRSSRSRDSIHSVLAAPSLIHSDTLSKETIRYRFSQQGACHVA